MCHFDNFFFIITYTIKMLTIIKITANIIILVFIETNLYKMYPLFTELDLF